MGAANQKHPGLTPAGQRGRALPPWACEPVAFHDRFAVTLTITIGETTHAIPGANVKAFDLELTSYGFTGSVEFIVADDRAKGGKERDALFAGFVTQDLVEVSLSVAATFPDPETEPSIAPVSVTGLVTTKSVEENQDPTHKDRAILWRRYQVEFADPARVLWAQHFPCELYTQKSMQDVIDAHRGAKIAVTYDWPALAAEAPMLFLNLGPDDDASFYDFIAWYTDRHAGVFTYDYRAKGYKLSAAKDASGTPASLFGDDVAHLRAVFPEVARYQRNVQNSYTESATTKPVASAQAVDPIRQDYLLRTPIAQRVDDRVTLETSRFVLRSSELELHFNRWPTISFGPGSLITFAQGNLWAADALPLAQTWRVIAHRVKARARRQTPDADRNLDATAYEVEVFARLEQQGDTYPRLPTYVEPTYPGHVEGKVVSEQGDDADLTYQFYTDEDTSLDRYKVKVPLWGDQVITAPYDPRHGSGKMYVPVYKTARVLLDLWLDEASIARLLDWRPGVRMAMDAQGEQLFFGKQATAGTMVNHAYEDAKPVFKIARAHDKDKATIQIKEGVLTIEVKEDP